MKISMLIAALAACILFGCGAKSPEAANGGSAGGSAEPVGAAPSMDVPQDCKASDDCDLVEACCGCSAGGTKLAIRKDAIAAYEASREQRCGQIMCAQMISNHPSCSAEAICGSRNRCTVVPHRTH